MRRARILGSITLLVSVCLAACGSSSKSGNDGNGSAGATSKGGGAGKSSTGAGGAGLSFGGSSGNNAGAGGFTDACVETKQVGKLVPLDIFIMLDISSSMLDVTSASAGAPTKWDAVKSALESFLRDPASSGLGVGIQYFPQRDPAVPATCRADSDCGTHGPCFLKFCQAATAAFYPCSVANDCVTVDNQNLGPCTPLRFCAPLINGELELCHNNTECATSQSCVPFNECTNDPTYVCQQAGAQCGTTGGQNLGQCRTPTSSCVHTSSCDAALYAQPAAAIATLPDSLNALVTSIDAQMPHGDTPSAPALKGAIQAASTWASAHPDHTVVTLLATDGLPTECIADPVGDASGVQGVRAVAQAGLAATPRIATFVIGVFGPTDTDARMNLNQIAMAGGSETAFLVDTSQDVSAQFLAALNKIRSSQLSCEYVLPAPPSGQTLDFTRINVDFTNNGSTERLGAVSDASACGNGEGWYFDQNPTAGGKPSKILVCPATCTRLQAASQGSVQVALGCQTQVR